MFSLSVAHQVLEYFVFYFACVAVVVACMFNRRRFWERMARIPALSTRFQIIHTSLVEIRNSKVVYLCKWCVVVFWV